MSIFFRMKPTTPIGMMMLLFLASVNAECEDCKKCKAMKHTFEIFFTRTEQNVQQLATIACAGPKQEKTKCDFRNPFGNVIKRCPDPKDGNTVEEACKKKKFDSWNRKTFECEMKAAPKLLMGKQLERGEAEKIQKTLDERFDPFLPKGSVKDWLKWLENKKGRHSTFELTTKDKGKFHNEDNKVHAIIVNLNNKDKADKGIQEWILKNGRPTSWQNCDAMLKDAARHQRQYALQKLGCKPTSFLEESAETSGENLDHQAGVVNGSATQAAHKVARRAASFT